MNSPLGSPRRLASAIHIRNKVPTQMRRCLPLYTACVVILFVLLNLDIIMAIPSPVGVFRREQPLREGPGSTFPQKIWQTWKVDPTHFEERDLLVSRTWLEKNPGMRYEVLTDANEMAWIEEHFGPAGFDRPDIISFYRSIKLPIVKADLMRYMIMYVEGGIYADIDVEALRPFSRFIPARYDEEDIDLIVGVEVDNPAFKDHRILGKKSMSFCQWTFISRPQLPVMMTLIENIMRWFNEVAKEQRVALGDVSLDFDQIISGTGPTAFTNAILDYMNRRAKGPKITWDVFHNMDESRLVGGVLVLTVEAFCAGQGHSDSGNHNARNALVKHHFHASNWPSRHPRFKHPAYGQVEDCNWDAECVRKWDENIANWEKFSADERKEIIEQVKQATEAKAQAEQEFWQQQLPPLQQAL